MIGRGQPPSFRDGMVKSTAAVQCRRASRPTMSSANSGCHLRIAFIIHLDYRLVPKLNQSAYAADLLKIWRSNDAPARQGITEIRHVTGYLAYPSWCLR